VFARRGRNGHQHVPVQGLVAAGFGHRTSRAGDPQLHTHVVVANVVHPGPFRDGRPGRCPPNRHRHLLDPPHPNHHHPQQPRPPLRTRRPSGHARHPTRQRPR
jgi:hypothetical protein